MYPAIQRYYQRQGEALKEAVRKGDVEAVNEVLSDVERVVEKAKRSWIYGLTNPQVGDDDRAGRFFMFQEAVETYHRLLKWTDLGEIEERD